MSEQHSDWTARRILSELCDAGRRNEILTVFWKKAEQHDRLAVAMKLARAMHFRDETIRKAPAAKKAEWLAARAGSPEFEEALEMALMLYLTTERSEMLSAFLDSWGVPHDGGSIETDDYAVPTAESVRKAADDLSGRFDPADIRLYLSSAGLLMGGAWREATWPVVDAM